LFKEIAQPGSRTGTYIGETAVGRGLFAARPFRAGEFVGSVDGRFLRDAPNYGSDYCIGLDDTTTLEPTPPFSLLNHGCRPNCAVFYDCEEENGSVEGYDVWIETIRDLERGEELTIDYAWPSDAAIPCKCGSTQCRGWICREDELHNLQRTSTVEESARDVTPPTEVASDELLDPQSNVG